MIYSLLVSDRLEDVNKLKQIKQGIVFGCVPYLLLIFFIVPWSFLWLGPSFTVAPLLGMRDVERSTLDIYAVYLAPFVLGYVAAVLLSYFMTRSAKPIFAKGLIITAFVVVGLSIVFLGLLSYRVYS